MRALAIAAVLAGAAAGFEAAREAFAQERFGDATVHLRELVAAHPGDDALRYDLALAALRAGELREAGEQLGRLADTSDASLARDLAFLAGNLEFERALRFAAQAEGPEAEPFAHDVAIGRARAALVAWRAAHLAGDERPQLLRNTERAAALVRELERRRAESRGEPLRTPGGAASANLVESEADGAASEAGSATEGGEVSGAEGSDAVGERGPAALDALLRHVAERQREKVAARRARLFEAAAAGGVAW